MSKQKGRKRKIDNEYDLQTILEDEESNDVQETAVPAASGRDAEKNDEAVRIDFASLYKFTNLI